MQLVKFRLAAVSVAAFGFVGLSLAGNVPGYVGLYARIPNGQNIELSGSPYASTAGAMGWVADSSLIPSASGTITYGYARGIAASTDPKDPRKEYLSGLGYSDGHGGIYSFGHWNGARIVDSPGSNEQDALMPGANPNDPSTWNIGQATLPTQGDLGQLYLAHNDRKVFFALERGTVAGAYRFEVELNQEHDAPYRPSRSQGDVMVRITGVGATGFNAQLFTWTAHRWVSTPKPQSALSAVTNAGGASSEPWGMLSGAGGWQLGSFAPSQFMEGAIDLGALKTGWSSALSGSSGVYVQFRSGTVGGNNPVDITPIYGIALNHPVAVPYIDRFAQELVLDANNSFDSDGGPVQEITWTIQLKDHRISAKDAATFGINLGAQPYSDFQPMGTGKWTVTTTDPNRLVDIGFTYPDSAPQSVRFAVSLTVKSASGSDTSGEAIVEVWRPAVGIVRVLDAQARTCAYSLTGGVPSSFYTSPLVVTWHAVEGAFCDTGAYAGPAINNYFEVTSQVWSGSGTSGTFVLAPFSQSLLDHVAYLDATQNILGQAENVFEPKHWFFVSWSGGIDPSEDPYVSGYGPSKLAFPTTDPSPQLGFNGTEINL